MIKKKSKVVEELAKDFDRKVESKKKANEEYSKEKVKHDGIFKRLMNDNFFREINELMGYFDTKLNPLHNAGKCGLKVDESNYRLTFHSDGHDNFPVHYKYDINNIKVRGLRYDDGGKLFWLKQSREAEKYFLKLMTKHMEQKIK